MKAKSVIINSLLVAIIFLIILIIVSNPGITGFLTLNSEKYSYEELLNSSIASNLTLSFNINSSQGNLIMNSLFLSGSLEGEGNARVYLIIRNQSFLVFDSEDLVSQPRLITGYVTLDTNEELGTINDSFENISDGVELNVSDGVELNVSDGVELNVSDGVELNVSDGVELNVSDGVSVKTILFEDVCEETCSLPAINNVSDFTLAIEVDEGSTLNLGSIFYIIEKIESNNSDEEEINNAPINNINQSEGNVSYEKIKLDNDYTAIIDSVNRANNSLIITLHHDAAEALVIKLKGSVKQYSISKEEILPYETSTITIPNYNNEYFRIYVETKEEII
jgi:hypothetical protein